MMEQHTQQLRQRKAEEGRRSDVQTQQQQQGKRRGRPKGATLTVAQKTLIELSFVDYGTRAQPARVLDMERSRTYLRERLSALAAAGLVLCLAGSGVSMPHVYTLTRKGREYVNSLLGTPMDKRFRPSEERKKARNEYFIKHTLAVTEVLIAARLLAHMHPDIALNRIFTERTLKRKIYVALAEESTENDRHSRTICIEPDAALDLTIQGKWQDLFYLEIYRNLPPSEWRFKQKIQGYVTMALTGQHAELFHTPAMSIAVVAATDAMTYTLKKWTEEALAERAQQGESNRFFFRSLDVTTVTPTELFLLPLWEQAFSDTKTPLLVLE